MADEQGPIDAGWYRAVHPDVDLLGVSAQEHYSRIGRLIGREARRASPADHLIELAAQVAALPPRQDGRERVEPTDLPTDDLPIVPSPPGLQAPPSQPLRRDSRLVVRAGAVDLAGARDEAGLDAARGPLEAFCRLHRLDPMTILRVGRTFEGPSDGPNDGGVGHPPWTPYSSHPVSIAKSFPSAPPRGLADVWFTSTHGLRLSFDREAGRVDASALRLFQVDPWIGDRIVRIGAAALQPGRMTFLDAALANPFLPILLETADLEGATIRMDLLPFPSLARGGRHHLELIALSDGDGSPATLWRYAAARLADLGRPDRSGLAGIAVSLEGATGGEPIFSTGVAQWLRLLDLPVEPAVDATLQDRARLASIVGPRSLGQAPTVSPGGAPILVLPPNGLPSVAAVTGDFSATPRPAPDAASDATRLDDEIAPFLIAARGPGRAGWAVTLPPGSATLDPLKSGGTTMPTLRGAVLERPSLPLALVSPAPPPADDAGDRGPHGLDVLPPPADGSRDVTCVLFVREAGDARDFLRSLALQLGVERVQVALRGDGGDRAALEPDLEALFRGRHRWLEPNQPLDPESLLAVAEGRALLLAEDRTRLHDPQTLRILQRLLGQAEVASAACVTLHEDRIGEGPVARSESGGFFPSRIGLIGGPHPVFDQPDTAAALPRSTFPVVANAFAATLIDPGALEAAKDRLSDAELTPLAFGLASLALGRRHLCTSVVRMGSVQPRRRSDRTEPGLLRVIAPERWEILLSRVTHLREIR